MSCVKCEAAEGPAICLGLVLFLLPREHLPDPEMLLRDWLLVGGCRQPVCICTITYLALPANEIQLGNYK